MQLINLHCVESVRIRSFSVLYFSTFGLNTEIYREILCIQPKCAKIRTRKTPNMGTFYAVRFFSYTLNIWKFQLRFGSISSELWSSGENFAGVFFFQLQNISKFQDNHCYQESSWLFPFFFLLKIDHIDTETSVSRLPSFIFLKL